MENLEKTKEFCCAYGLEMPIIMAPMAGACPAELAAAVSNAADGQIVNPHAAPAATVSA